MPSKPISSLIEIEPLPATNDDKLMRDLGGALKDLQHSLGAIDEDNPSATDAEADLEQYATKVDEVVSTMQDRVETMKAIHSDADELITGLDLLLDHIPFHSTFSAKAQAARNVEEWCSNNCSKGYEFIGIKDACIVVFDDAADHTLFKINFGGMLT